ncbi:MAG: hypothetical protein ACRD1D_04380 [Acidimicrobiales bacterium]
MNVPNLKLTRRTGILVALSALVVGVGGWAFAEGGTPLSSSGTSDTVSATTSTTVGTPGAATDNVAAAVNTTDGKTVYAISLKIVQTDDNVVDAANAAVAVASCTDCQTVAIALEGLVVIGSPDTFVPVNLALAINSDCTNCQTLASAYQLIVQNDTRVRISGAGRREIADIRQELQMLRTSELDITAIQQIVDEAAARFLHVLQKEVYPIGRPRPDAASTTTTAPASSPSSSTTTAAPVTTSTTTTAVESTTTTAVESTTTTTP